ncbi:hypothetical protein [Fibrobacter succinogenes]|uniref:Lipoprotein n=1 Tax=Fibrobacter succinogenes TaxID=833 RepID=A0A380S6K8_FIBSU|nr:hypothetical protein [Fibrobacter succinogenes]PWJ35713.1 hypothetical protein IE02_1768 [Fibrobacter succinogenes subsp. elongatus]SUQ24368.1 hypothetical protein SAMN05661053_1768 [Fibrobacter succinogenes]
MKRTLFLLCTFFYLCNLVACSETDSNTRYKLYPTQNMWTFLKLDTETGRIWQVHYSIKGKDTRFEEPLNTGNIAKALKKEQKIGRYALYQTQNMYNFILLDQIDGETYQVQWGLDKQSRLLIPISE